MKLFEEKKSGNHLIWKVVGGAALAVVVTAVAVSFKDIVRYIKISTM
jgi:uncharacterized protein DUF6893